MADRTGDDGADAACKPGIRAEPWPAVPDILPDSRHGGGQARSDAMAAGFTVLGVRRQSASCQILEARDAAGRPAVVKRVPGLDALGRRRLAREARLGRLLRNPGLAVVLGDGADWIAFEPLAERTETSGRASEIVREVARVLGHLHGCGVVHRDLKPAHVMYRGTQPVIIDLGVAGLVGGDALEGTEIVGSPGWMAPEQLLGAAPAPAADIWSLCALACWLSGGGPPYAGTADAVLEARRAGAPPRLDLSAIADRKLAAMVRAGLGPPSQRPSAAQIAALLG